MLAVRPVSVCAISFIKAHSTQEQLNDRRIKNMMDILLIMSYNNITQEFVSLIIDNIIACFSKDTKNQFAKIYYIFSLLLRVFKSCIFTYIIIAKKDIMKITLQTLAKEKDSELIATILIVLDYSLHVKEVISVRTECMDQIGRAHV